jgi:hypothetical protein
MQLYPAPADQNRRPRRPRLEVIIQNFPIKYRLLMVIGRPPPDYGPYQGPNSGPRRRY